MASILLPYGPFLRLMEIYLFSYSDFVEHVIIASYAGNLPRNRVPVANETFMRLLI